MYPVILSIHSFVRWLVLLSLLFAIYRAYSGLFSKRNFSKFDNSVRHWSATFAHIQLLLGLWLYFISPVVEYFIDHYKEAVHERSIRFFGMEHASMMLIAIVLITIGSASAKRKATDKAKFKTIAVWYSIALIIILINIPWPFSPFANRPYIRTF